MRWLNRTVSGLWLYPVAIFSAICVFPWWKSKSGRLHPLGTPYVNDLEGSQFLLLCHPAATAGLSVAVILLHLFVRRLAKSKK